MKQPASFHGSSIIALYTFAELPRTAWRLQLMISEDNPLPMCSPEAVAPRRPLSHICRQHCTSLNRKQCRISEARMVTTSIIPALIATSFVFLEVLSTPLLIKHFFFLVMAIFCLQWDTFCEWKLCLQTGEMAQKLGKLILWEDQSLDSYSHIQWLTSS